MNNNKQTDILFILASSFIVVAAWIGFNLYHKWATSTISPEIQVQIIPIDPNFDQETIDKLKTRKNIAPMNQLNGVADVSPTPARTPSPIPEDITSQPTQAPTDNNPDVINE